MHKFIQYIGILVGVCWQKLQANWLVMPIMMLAFTMLACATTVDARFPEANTCSAADWKPGAPGCLPPSGHFCEKQESQADIVSTPPRNPQFIAQGFSIFPSKEILGPAQPRCPSNATMLVHEMDEKRVKEGAAELGKQVGLIMGKCEVILDGLTRNPDQALNLWYATHPEQLAQILNMCAEDLATIPEMPQFEDAHLAMAAEAGFTKGFGAGKDEIANKVLVFELALDTLEMIVLPEVMLAEVAITNAIRKSIGTLRRMPVFVPGAVGGLGVFLKVAPKVAVQTVARTSSKALARAMKLAGKIRLPGEFAHHIVAHGDPRARVSREILEKFGVKLDEAVNGIFLPGFKKSANPQGKAVHATVHTDAYYAGVEALLKKATTQNDVIQTLRYIASRLEHGLMP